jgi:uncharacterized membrane protein
MVWRYTKCVAILNLFIVYIIYGQKPDIHW